MGRPPKIKSPQEMEEKIEAYFAWCDANPIQETITKNGIVTIRTKARPYLMPGLAWRLGFDSTQALGRYRGTFDHLRESEISAEEKEKRKQYVSILTRAKTRMLDQKLTYGIAGEYDPKMVAIDLAAHHNISTNPKPEGEQNITLTFVNATKSKEKGSESQADMQD